MYYDHENTEWHRANRSAVLETIEDRYPGFDPADFIDDGVGGNDDDDDDDGTFVE